jgi:hypothetical protein
MQTEMTVQFKAFEVSYTSDVTCIPNLSVEVGIFLSRLKIQLNGTCRPSLRRRAQSSRV